MSISAGFRSANYLSHSVRKPVRSCGRSPPVRVTRSRVVDDPAPGRRRPRRSGARRSHPPGFEPVRTRDHRVVMSPAARRPGDGLGHRQSHRTHTPGHCSGFLKTAVAIANPWVARRTPHHRPALIGQQAGQPRSRRVRYRCRWDGAAGRGTSTRSGSRDSRSVPSRRPAHASSAVSSSHVARAPGHHCDSAGQQRTTPPAR